MRAPCDTTTFPAVERPLKGVNQERCSRHHRGIEGGGGPPDPHVDPHGGPLGRSRVAEHVVKVVEHCGCGAVVEGGESLGIPAPGGLQQGADLVQLYAASTHDQPARDRQKQYTGVRGVELSLRLRTRP